MKNKKRNQAGHVKKTGRNGHLERFENYADSVKSLKKFSEAPECTNNPFHYRLIENMTIERKVVHAENRMSSVDITDRVTGEVISAAEENRVFVKRQTVDNKKFVKIYSERIKMMFDLSHSAIKVFGFFLHQMQQPYNIDKDVIYFDLKGCMEFCGYEAHAMVYRGLTELISKTFIAKANRPPSHYFVDASIAFNGNRILIMEEYVKKGDDHFSSKHLPETSVESKDAEPAGETRIDQKKADEDDINNDNKNNNDSDNDNDSDNNNDNDTVYEEVEGDKNDTVDMDKPDDTDPGKEDW